MVRSFVLCAAFVGMPPSAVTSASQPPAEPADGQPAKPEASLYPGFEGYSRSVTTNSAEAQKWFNQGIQLLYGYNHDEAIRSFEKAAQIDPSCAMAWWESPLARRACAASAAASRWSRLCASASGSFFRRMRGMAIKPPRRRHGGGFRSRGTYRAVCSASRLVEVGITA